VKKEKKKDNSRLLDLLGVSSESSSEEVGPVVDVLDSRSVGNSRNESGEESSGEDEELFLEEELEELLNELGLWFEERERSQSLQEEYPSC